MSPPLTLGLAGWAVARARGAPFVFNIQDVFPDVAVELGMITNPSVIGVASALERFTYLRSDAVTVLSDDLRDNVRAKTARHGRRPNAGHASSRTSSTPSTSGPRRARTATAPSTGSAARRS